MAAAISAIATTISTSDGNGISSLLNQLRYFLGSDFFYVCTTVFCLIFAIIIVDLIKIMLSFLR